ncbi:MAG: helix-turn-helix transcriptional regulator [Oscillibacter sp.]|nr:helix-turn-helix transcriptional regulator [Oscillibacter sp.]
MIRLNVSELLEKRGKTRYWLSRQMGISYQNVCRMTAQQTRGIRFETLETLCQVLDCTPNDLFTIDFDEPEKR